MINYWSQNDCMYQKKKKKQIGGACKMKGSYTKRGDKWYFRIDAGKDPITGKRKQIQRGGFKTKKEAQQAAAELLKEIEKGKVLYKQTMKLSQLFEVWYDIKKHSLSDNAKVEYQNSFKRLIKFIDDFSIHQIKPYHIQHVYSKLVDEYAYSTCKTTHAILMNMFKFAAQNGWVDRNILEVKLPKKKSNKRAIWNEQQIKKFIEVSKYSRYHALFYLTLNTGLRLGEVRALTWQDVDFENQIITIDKAMPHFSFSFKDVAEPKTESSYRTIYVPDDVLITLKEFKKQYWYKNNDNVIFITKNSQVASPQLINKILKQIIKKAELPIIRFHDLRHIHASILINAGVNPKVVSERLGHANVSTTLNIYTKISNKSHKEAANVFSDVTNQ